MWRYDPQGFKNKLRQKVKLRPYIHHPMLEIERYCNQFEQLENTLIDKDSTQVDVENTLFDLERQLDESSFLQVPQQEATMSTPTFLQTPQNEEKNPKRNREGASSSDMDTSNVQYEANQSKRLRLNPVSEQEDTKGSVELTNTELNMSKGRTPSRETQEPSISHTQML